MGFLSSQFSVTPRYPTGNFDGKNIVITGSDNGRGREAARHHAHLGANKLILGAHSLEKGEVAR
jgi:NAD(P)-dependent dehydrogenase (short-subunit alcohol dehydrogenase family)